MVGVVVDTAKACAVVVGVVVGATKVGAEVVGEVVDATKADAVVGITKADAVVGAFSEYEYRRPVHQQEMDSAYPMHHSHLGLGLEFCLSPYKGEAKR
ncbi:hypothetical protein AALP_AA7G124900 [Arabis alpina]|uniref:Uncharacterized protein n=1 Tax=Arabis alpina TaxID=50452 RepID=A0A087GHL5_ARAAL|nr:hypothetical protein AALP_AA7G124900 [Arabis alpina]